MEFNATAFKTLPTDMVQDLLRKLPGVSIDPEGNVTVNGQKVDKIQVDGRDKAIVQNAINRLPLYTIKYLTNVSGIDFCLS